MPIKFSTMSPQVITTFVWMFLMTVEIIVEAMTQSMLVTIWFIPGTVLAVLASAMGAPLIVQIVIMVVVSCISIAWSMKSGKSLLEKFTQHTNADRILNREGYVTEKIDNLAGTGRIKIDGIEWTARTVSDEVIEEGSVVRIERIEGVKAFCSPVKTEESADKKPEIIPENESTLINTEPHETRTIDKTKQNNDSNEQPDEANMTNEEESQNVVVENETGKEESGQKKEEE